MTKSKKLSRGAAQNPPLWRAQIKTPDGVFRAAFSAYGLAQLDFPGRAEPANTDAPEPIPATREQKEWLKQTHAAIAALLAGRTPKVFPPLDFSGGTPFQQRVWQALRAIPLGETRSYGELAHAVGAARAARAVGAACGANPVPLLVPCHRVLAANGKLGGFSGGPEWKPRLLRREGSWT